LIKRRRRRPWAWRHNQGIIDYRRKRRTWHPRVPYGNVWWVDGTNGNDANVGDSRERPWATIQKAADTATAGDLVWIRGGTYVELVDWDTNSGTQVVTLQDVNVKAPNKVEFGASMAAVAAGDIVHIYDSRMSNNGAFEVARVGDTYVLVDGQPFTLNETANVQATISRVIYFKNYNDEAVLLDPGALVAHPPARVMNAVQRIVLDGIDVTGSAHAGLEISHGTRHIVVQNCAVYQNNSPGIYIFDDAQYSMIYDVEIWDNGQGANGEGVYIGLGAGGDTCHHNHVCHCWFHDNGATSGCTDECVDIKPDTDYTVVEHCLFEDNFSTWGQITLSSGCSNSVLYGNVFDGNDGNANWSGHINVQGVFSLIFNNLIYNAGTDFDGFRMVDAVGGSNNLVYHNIIMGCDVGIYWDADGAPSTYEGDEVKNNIFSGNTLQMQWLPETGETVDTNVIWGVTNDSGANPILADPMFVGGGDYHIQAGSPARNAGLVVGILSDLDLNIRPMGGAPDVGCYEYIE